MLQLRAPLSLFESNQFQIPLRILGEQKVRVRKYPAAKKKRRHALSLPLQGFSNDFKTRNCRSIVPVHFCGLLRVAVSLYILASDLVYRWNFDADAIVSLDCRERRHECHSRKGGWL